ncbi:MAG: hypothetical protein HC769_11870 [Cyanobacteria bacterium CRU_2_1]|nr:hypothetical protein [Cyanobacteria bacterium RU_5_0]NJR59476.1 hypothetical protein [Cyanobacteria bacterium CRU_2_1]
MNSLPNKLIPSASLFRLLGYGFLLISLIDLIATLTPFRFTNPLWEFQTIGSLVEQTPVPLLGLILVFYGGWEERSAWEPFALKILSWLALIAGVILLLLIPLGISSTLRINALNERAIAAQVTQQQDQIQQFRDRLNQVSEDDLNSLLAQANAQSQVAEISPETFKDKLLEQTNSAIGTLQSEANVAQEQQQQELLKNSAKWNLGALITGTLFILIWRHTRWARRSAAWRRAMENGLISSES